MAIQNFDNINILKRHSMPYEKYFGDMELSQKQKKHRIDTALILEDIIAVILMLVQNEAEVGAISPVLIKQQMIFDLLEPIENGNFFDSEEQLDRYITNITDEIVDSTIRNLEKYPNDYDYTGETNYWVSEDRAEFIAENEANTLCNNKDYLDAKAQGKTRKIWMAFPDDRVRPTHVEANGSEVPIDNYFSVGGARMLYPRDTSSKYSTASSYPEEVVNCRCQVLYV